MSETTASASAPAAAPAPVAIDDAVLVAGASVNAHPEVDDDPDFAEVPESDLLPPAVAGQTEIAPDVTAQDLGVNTEPIEPVVDPVSGVITNAPSSTVEPIGTVLTDGGDGVAPAEIVNPDPPPTGPPPPPYVDPDAPVDAAPEQPGRERAPPHQPPAPLTEEEIAAKVAGRAEADAAAKGGGDTDAYLTKVNLQSTFVAPGHELGAVVAVDPRFNPTDLGLRHIVVDQLGRLWAAEGRDDEDGMSLVYIGWINT